MEALVVVLLLPLEAELAIELLEAGVGSKLVACCVGCWTLICGNLFEALARCDC